MKAVITFLLLALPLFGFTQTTENTTTETLLQFYKDATEDFWVFCGYGLITGTLTYFLLQVLQMILNFFRILWIRFWRHWTIKKHGYPPNCDADGDFR